MTQMETEKGWMFVSSAQVIIGDKTYDMDELTEDQKLYVSGKLEEQALNAAFAGRAKFQAENLPNLKDCF